MHGARRKLISHGWPVRSAALSCGFRSPSYFTQAFHGHYGLTPTQLRKALAINRRLKRQAAYQAAYRVPRNTPEASRRRKLWNDDQRRLRRLLKKFQPPTRAIILGDGPPEEREAA